MSEDTVTVSSLSQTVADLSAAVSSIQRQQERLLDTLVSSQVQPSSNGPSHDSNSGSGGSGEFLFCFCRCSGCVLMFLSLISVVYCGRVWPWLALICRSVFFSEYLFLFVTCDAAGLFLCLWLQQMVWLPFAWEVWYLWLPSLRILLESPFSKVLVVCILVHLLCAVGGWVSFWLSFLVFVPL